VRGGLLAVFFWMLARSVEVTGQLLQGSAWALDRPAAHALVPLASRAGKVLILAVAVIALFSVLGYPVASLLAGLGIGGLVVARGFRSRGFSTLPASGRSCCFVSWTSSSRAAPRSRTRRARSTTSAASWPRRHRRRVLSARSAQSADAVRGAAGTR
jgi:hypothetical protein